MAGRYELPPFRLPVLIAAVIGVCATAVADLITGTELSLVLFHAALVGMVAWGGSWPWVLVAILLSTFGTALTELLGRDSLLTGLWNTFARSVFLLGEAFLIVALRESLRRERRNARTDPATGAANRHALYERALTESERARRLGSGLAIAFFDIDDLKTLNDRAGHAAGDELLRRFVESAQRHLRRTDVFARFGGDEFVLLLPDTDEAGAREVVERMMQQFDRAAVETGEIGTVSAGLAAWTSGIPLDVDALLEVPDKLMYEAKGQGRGRLVSRTLD